MNVGDLIQIELSLDPYYVSEIYLVIDIDLDFKFEDEPITDPRLYPPITCYKLIGPNGMTYFCMKDPVTKFKILSPSRYSL